jgi:S-adenosylmethionine decarboxylase
MKKINIAYIMLFVVILITVFGIFYKTREMEFAESPIPLGVHYIVDIDNIKNKNLYSNEFIKNLCSKLLSNTGVNVLNEIHHEFQPQGYTALYLLSESHMSIHTWPENGKVRIDLFSCVINGKFDDALNILKTTFKDAQIRIKTIFR